MTQDITLADQTMRLEVGRYAPQATSAVLARLGDTVVHATVVVGKENPQIGYLPLHVEYQEKLYAGGKIKGSRWVKREGRPSDEAILTSRLIDRSLRPLLPKSFRKEIQIIITTLSVDGDNDPDIPSLVAASAALSLAKLPFSGPVGAVRVGYVPQNGVGNFVTNPTHQDRQYSDMDLVVSGTTDGVVMVEAGSRETSEQVTLAALQYGQQELQKVIDGIKKLMDQAGVVSLPPPPNGEGEVGKLAKKILKVYGTDLAQMVSVMATKESGSGLHLDEMAQAIAQKESIDDVELVGQALDKAINTFIRQRILAEGIRPDGRKSSEIRPITCRVGELPRTHGSALFQRGATQALTIVTLASPASQQWIESPEAEETKRYIHHYNMPPFSVGEVDRLGWPSRREVGHGALAERALLPVIPPESEFPYTIRVVSEIMSSNGSTSMASVCGSTLSLMDAGVPIKSPVAGIAMGLIVDRQRSVVLSDIIGLEDFNGDMDFKVAGTKNGITALQMDVKIPGVRFEVLEQALSQANQGRLFILERMLAVQANPNAQISKFAPKISVLQIEVSKIGDVIGPGGKTIKQIIAETGTVIDVEDDGTVTVAGTDQAAIDRAVDWIKGLTQSAHVGEEYEGKVVRVVPFGVFVNILPGKDGLVHISKLSTGYLSHPTDVVNEGDNMKVRVAEIDDQGRINLVPVSPFTPPAGSVNAPPRHQEASSRGGQRLNRRFAERGSFPRRGPLDRPGSSTRPGQADRPRGGSRKPYYDRHR